jgi:hypothetical protein
MHSKPTTDPPRLGQLILILVLDPVLLDLTATLTPRLQRRVELLINLPRRLAMPVPTMLIPRPAPRPTRALLRLPARERRRLTLPRPPRLLQLPLKLRDPRPQPPILTRQPNRLGPQLLVLGRKRLASRDKPAKLAPRLDREHLNLNLWLGDGNHRHQISRQANRGRDRRL